MRRTHAAGHQGGYRTTLAGLVAVMAGLLGPCDVRAGEPESELWVCTDRKDSPQSGRPPLELILQDGLLIEQPLGSPRYSLLANSEYAIIGVDHSAEFEPVLGTVNIFVSTVAIDRSTGNFTISMSVGDKTSEHRAGHCRRFDGPTPATKTLARRN